MAIIRSCRAADICTGIAPSFLTRIEAFSNAVRDWGLREEHSANERPANRSALACSGPPFSEPARGCPPTNMTSGREFNPRAVFITGTFNPATSITKAPRLARSRTCGNSFTTDFSGTASTTVAALESASSNEDAARSTARSDTAAARLARLRSQPTTFCLPRRRSASPMDAPMSPVPTMQTNGLVLRLRFNGCGRVRSDRSPDGASDRPHLLHHEVEIVER